MTLLRKIPLEIKYICWLFLSTRVALTLIGIISHTFLIGTRFSPRAIVDHGYPRTNQAVIDGNLKWIDHGLNNLGQTIIASNYWPGGANAETFTDFLDRFYASALHNRGTTW